MSDIFVVVLFLVAFSGLIFIIYRIIGDDADKVHGCCSGGMVIEEKEKIESQ